MHRTHRKPVREHQSIWILSEEEATIMIFVPIRRIGVATCVTPTDHGGSLTRTIGLGSNKSSSLSLSLSLPSSLSLPPLPPLLSSPSPSFSSLHSLSLSFFPLLVTFSLASSLILTGGMQLLQSIITKILYTKRILSYLCIIQLHGARIKFLSYFRWIPLKQMINSSNWNKREKVPNLSNLKVTKNTFRYELFFSSRYRMYQKMQIS